MSHIPKPPTQTVSVTPHVALLTSWELVLQKNIELNKHTILKSSLQCAHFTWANTLEETGGDLREVSVLIDGAMIDGGALTPCAH